MYPYPGKPPYYICFTTRPGEVLQVQIFRSVWTEILRLVADTGDIIKENGIIASWLCRTCAWQKDALEDLKPCGFAMWLWLHGWPKCFRCLLFLNRYWNRTWTSMNCKFVSISLLKLFAVHIYKGSQQDRNALPRYFGCIFLVKSWVRTFLWWCFLHLPAAKQELFHLPLRPCLWRLGPLTSPPLGHTTSPRNCTPWATRIRRGLGVANVECMDGEWTSRLAILMWTFWATRLLAMCIPSDWRSSATSSHSCGWIIPSHSRAILVM